MKILLLLLISFQSFAGDFFVNNSGNDANSGTQASPWQTVNKVNSTPVSGDKVRFAGGQVFYGALTPKSGVTFDSYGSGKATITGFTTITSWTPLSNGLFETSISSQVNMVVVNDQFQPIGRWPKLSASNKGYLTFNSHGGSSIGSSQLAGAPSFVGGEIVVRNCHWILNRYAVGSQNTSTVTYSSGSNYSRTDDGNGFFFQNHVNACTQLGDWMWSGGKLRIFGQPGTVKASTVSNLVTISSKTDISFTNIIFQGASNHVFSITNSQRIKLTDCEVNYAGNDGMNTNSGTNNITLLRTNFNWSNNNHIRSNLATDWNIQDCVFTNNGMTAGMGQSGDGSYYGISDLANNSLFQYNTLINTGYVGINFNGGPGVGNVNILNNFIDGYCLVKDDGAGIYTGYVGGMVSHPQCRIENNIVKNGKGAGEGAGGVGEYSQTHGIYLDDYSNNIIVSGNSVTASAGGGIYLHLSQNITLNNNTTFANKNEELLISATENSTGAIRGINMSGNIFFNMTADNSAKFFTVLVRCLSGTDISQWGTWNNNYYCRPLNAEKQSIYTIRAGSANNMTLAQWQALSGKDQNSKVTPVAVTDPNKIRFEYNESKLARVVTLPGNFMDVAGIVYSGHITLAPYSSAVLIQTASGPATYQSTAKSGSFTRNNCPAGSTGSSVVYSVPSGKYTSTVSQTDADSKASADVTTNGQPYANINGVCTTIPPVTYSSASKSGTFTKNNCPVGQTGSQVTYTVAAGKYTSSLSQADADSKAVADVSTNGQPFANTNGVCSTPPPPTVYQSAGILATFTRNNCPTGQSGSAVNYLVNQGKYTSTVSQVDADNKAKADVNTNGQNYANGNGICTPTPPVVYTSVSKSGTYTRNNCGSGYKGSQVQYTVPSGKYSSSVSQGDADGQAQGDVNANGQTYANQRGTCSPSSCSFWDKLFRRKGCRF